MKEYRFFGRDLEGYRGAAVLMSQLGYRDIRFEFAVDELTMELVISWTEPFLDLENK